MTSGTSYVANRRMKKDLAASVSRYSCRRMSNTSPCSSTAHHSQWVTLPTFTHLFQMPPGTPPGFPVTQFLGAQRGELDVSLPQGFVAFLKTAFVEQPLHVTLAQGKTVATAASGPPQLTRLLSLSCQNRRSSRSGRVMPIRFRSSPRTLRLANVDSTDQCAQYRVQVSHTLKSVAMATITWRYADTHRRTQQVISSRTPRRAKRLS